MNAFEVHNAEYYLCRQRYTFHAKLNSSALAPSLFIIKRENDVRFLSSWFV